MEINVEVLLQNIQAVKKPLDEMNEFSQKKYNITATTMPAFLAYEEALFELSDTVNKLSILIEKNLEELQSTSNAFTELDESFASNIDSAS